MLTLIGVGVYLVGVFASRWIKERSYKLLSTEEKGRLVEEFSKARMLVLAVTVVLAGGCFLLFWFSVVSTLVFGIVMSVGLLVTVVWASVYSTRVHRRMGIPAGYTRAYWISTAVSTTATMLFVFIITVGSKL